MFSDHSDFKLEINNKNTTRKIHNWLKLSNNTSK